MWWIISSKFNPVTKLLPITNFIPFTFVPTPSYYCATFLLSLSFTCFTQLWFTLHWFDPLSLSLALLPWCDAHVDWLSSPNKTNTQSLSVSPSLAPSLSFSIYSSINYISKINNLTIKQTDETHWPTIETWKKSMKPPTEKLITLGITTIITILNL